MSNTSELEMLCATQTSGLLVVECLVCNHIYELRDPICPECDSVCVHKVLEPTDKNFKYFMAMRESEYADSEIETIDDREITPAERGWANDNQRINWSEVEHIFSKLEDIDHIKTLKRKPKQIPILHVDEEELLKKYCMQNMEILKSEYIIPAYNYVNYFMIRYYTKRGAKLPGVEKSYVGERSYKYFQAKMFNILKRYGHLISEHKMVSGVYKMIDYGTHAIIEAFSDSDNTETFSFPLFLTKYKFTPNITY